MKQVGTKEARQCVAEFEQFMKKLGVDTPAKGLTTSVCFERKDMMDWLQKLEPSVKKIKICFGMNRSESAEISLQKSKSEDDRPTVYLWPCDENDDPAKDGDGGDVPPVNYGDTLP